MKTLYLSLYQVNTRVWLTGLSRSLGRPAVLDDIQDVELERLAKMGFDWLWFLSVWQTGPAGQRVSRTNAGWRREFQETLPDLREEDIAGSGFAITAYSVPADLGGKAALTQTLFSEIKNINQEIMDINRNYDSTREDYERALGKFTEKKNKAVKQYLEALFAMREQTTPEKWKTLLR